MGTDRERTTLADVGVGTSAVLAGGPALDARQARRLIELGLRPGATVRVLMRTAGGGRVLGVDNLRIVLDRCTLGAIPVALPVPAALPAPTASPAPAPGPRPAVIPDPEAGADRPAPGTSTQGQGQDQGRTRGSRLVGPGRRLRLLRRYPGLFLLPGELLPADARPGKPVGDGAD